MAIETTITRKLDPGFVQIEVKSTKAPTRYFKVEETKADEFCANYKKRNKKDNLTSNLILIGSVLAGTLISAPLTNKIKNFIPRMLVGAIPCVGLAIIANALAIPKLAAKHTEFVKNNGGEEIYYDNKKFPV